MLGGSRFQIGGPAAAFIGLVAITVERHGYDGLVLATVIAGLILVTIGFLRLGTYVKYIPYPVTVGFTAGIAVIILITQVRDLFGLKLAHEPADTLPKIGALWNAIGTVSPVTVALSIFSIGAILVVRRLRPNWPALLIAVAGATIVTALLGLPTETIGSRFGTIQSGLPAPALPPFSLEKVRAVLPDAFAIALLGAIESLFPLSLPTACRGGGIAPTANWWRKASAMSPPHSAAACLSPARSHAPRRISAPAHAARSPGCCTRSIC